MELQRRIHTNSSYLFRICPEIFVWYWQPYLPIHTALTHLPLVPHICVSESGQHWFRWWPVVYSAQSHYLNQCCVLVNWTLGNKVQWNLNPNSHIFIQENAFENIVCEMAAILSRRMSKSMAFINQGAGGDIIWCAAVIKRSHHGR